MQIYKDLNSPKTKEFEKLLNSQSSKGKIVEGKIIECEVAKITEKYIFVDYPGLKSEAVIDINEYKSINKNIEKIQIGDKISVLLEKLEDRNGEILVSAVKAFKILGWNKLVKKFESNEAIHGKIISRVKGGVIFEEKETKTLTFMPGSQISDKPLKDISHLMNVEIEAAIIKCDYNRGNICTSRRAIISSYKKEDKAKIIEKYKVGDIIKEAVVKSYTNFGVFFDVNNGELDCLVHLGEVSYSRVNHPDEIFNVGDKHDLKVISVDKEKLQVGCSIKQLLPDPFDHISNYEINKSYKVKIVKLTDWGAFAELEPGLSTLLHSSEISWTKKNISPKKIFKVNDVISCVITEIDTEKKRIAISHKLTKPNPYDELESKYPVNSTVSGVISNMNDYAIYLKLENLDIDGFCHVNDLSYAAKPEDELSKYKKGDKLKVKVLEIKKSEQKVRVGLKQLSPDPIEFFKDKKVNDTITVKVISSDNKGLLVKPEGSEMEFNIKKSEIAVNSSDARPSRFVGGERIDSAIKTLDIQKRKVSLSIKLLEELQNKAALEMGSNPLSGRQLPFSSLSEKLETKENKKKKE